MPTSCPDSAKSTPTLLLFAAAVAATATTFGLCRAIAKMAGKSYYVRYTSQQGHTIDTEPTRSAKCALHRLEKAIQNDNIHLS